MKTIFATDLSKYSERARTFLVNNEDLTGAQYDLFVPKLQVPVMTRVQRLFNAAVTRVCQREDGGKVLAPIRKFVGRHAHAYCCAWVAGSPAAQIVKASTRQHARLIVMGTHAQGFLGRAPMGTAAHRVVTDSEVPVLSAKRWASASPNAKKPCRH